MATSADLLADGFGRIRENVANVLDGLTPEQATYRVDADANPVSWLVWHLTRVQDDHVADAFGEPQVWTTGKWAARFGLPPATTDSGYGHTAPQVARFADACSALDLLLAYHEVVYAQTISLVSKVTDEDLDRVVDEHWTPPVTLGVRLMSVLNDDMQHAGQAAYVRGVALRAGGA
jgi:uncharacterized damage-inducible protein DinB